MAVGVGIDMCTWAHSLLCRLPAGVLILTTWGCFELLFGLVWFRSFLRFLLNRVFLCPALLSKIIKNNFCFFLLFFSSQRVSLFCSLVLLYGVSLSLHGRGRFVWFAMCSFSIHFVLENKTLVRFTSWRFVVILYLFDFRSSGPPQTFRSNVLRVSFPVKYEEREQIDQKQSCGDTWGGIFFCWNTYFAVLPYNWQVAKRARKGPKLWVVTNALRKSIWRWSSL